MKSIPENFVFYLLFFAFGENLNIICMKIGIKWVYKTLDKINLYQFKLIKIEFIVTQNWYENEIKKTTQMDSKWFRIECNWFLS